MSSSDVYKRQDFDRANWRPPLQPRMAYDLEARQIQRLNLNSLVSITDHDTIEAPMLLRTCLLYTSRCV